jgi:hypothetical protein
LGVVPSRQSCFTFLAAGLLWLCGVLPAHALHAWPSDGVQNIPISTVKTRVGDFSFAASGRLPWRHELSPANAPGSWGCGYETASGRGEWNEHDPNGYSFCGGDCINGFDSDGRCFEAAGSAVKTGVQDVYNVLYTGQVNPSPDVYDAAVDAAGDYVYDSGGVRGFYGGVGINSKYPGVGSLAGQGGLTGTWTVDSGAGAEVDVGAGLQERGQNSLGIFTSQTVGVGSSYQFWSQDTGFQAPALGSSGNISAPAIYGGTANSQGGANFIIQNQNNAGIGINYGPVYGGLIVNPSLVLQNFVDSYHIITGTH